MANLNKVMLIGRLTRDPEVRMFPNGGKVAKFGFAVNNRKKNPSTGAWEEVAVFIDVEAFNRGDFGKKADVVEQYLRKGSQIFIEGHLQLDQWTAQDGQKKSKLKVVLDNLEFLDTRQDGGGPRGAGQARAPAAPGGMDDGFESGSSEPPMEAPPPPAKSDEDIPF
jgi:single-strand DNA-binding protein